MDRRDFLESSISFYWGSWWWWRRRITTTTTTTTAAPTTTTTTTTTGEVNQLKYTLIGPDEIERAMQRWSRDQYGAHVVRTKATEGLQNSPQGGAHYTVPHPSQAGHQTQKNRLNYDGVRALAMALYYRVTGSDQHRDRTIDYLESWQTTTVNDDPQTWLTFSAHIVPLIAAAECLNISLPLFREWIWATRFNNSLQVKRDGNWAQSPYKYMQNNRQSWAVAHQTAAAAYYGSADFLIENQLELDLALVTQVNPNTGRLDNTGRNDADANRGNKGLHYTNYSLAALSLAAEIQKNQGRNQYNELPLLRLAWQYSIDWMDNPAGQNDYFNIGHWEWLSREWSEPAAGSIITNRRPIQWWGSFPFASLLWG